MFYSEFPYKKQKQTPVSGIITGTVTISEQMVHYSNFNITGTTKESKKMASPKINNLYICEKPSQARDLARILGLKTKHDYYISDANDTEGVTWCLGHLLELYLPDEYSEAWKKWHLDNLPIIPCEWKYRPRLASRKPGSKAQPKKDPEVVKHLNAIKKLINRASLITISTDYDREGEAIARLVMNEYASYKGPIKRLCLTALDDKSIRKSLNNILDGGETYNLYQAALARSRADWLVGMNLSRLFTITATMGSGVHSVLNIGRVVTPTISLVVQRQEEIDNFVPQQYYVLKAELAFSGCTYRAKWIPRDEAKDEHGYVTNTGYLQDLMNKLLTAPFTVSKYKCGNKNQKPPLPFDLTTLQQFANRRFGYTAKKTLEIAQSLYEKKMTTYPRTDCRYLPVSLHDESPEIISAASSDGFFSSLSTPVDPQKRHYAFNTSKVTAHHAIIPTSVPIAGQHLSSDELNIYNMVRSSFIALFMPEAVFRQTTIELDAIGECFKAKASELVSPGWKELYTRPSDGSQNDDGEMADYKKNDKKNENGDNSQDSGEEINKSLPETREGDIHDLVQLIPSIETTTPPSPFTEATLLGAMENISRYVTDPDDKKILKETDGLGTPATRADIISNAIARSYLYYEGKHILPTEKGTSMIHALPKAIKDVGVTARWEKGLEMIASGSMNYERFMEHISSWIINIINENRNIPIHIEASTKESAPATGKTGRTYRKRTGAAAGKTGTGTGRRRAPAGKTATTAGGRRKAAKSQT